MWAYTVAAKVNDIYHDLVPKFQAQPPWDITLDGFYILHYTYGNDYTKEVLVPHEASDPPQYN
eukprot:630171-Pyramimonas_sp.AAC.1